MRIIITKIALFYWVILLGCSGSEPKNSEPPTTLPEKDQAPRPESSKTPTVPRETLQNENSILMVIAPKNFRDEELFVTREILEGAGYKITLASTTTEEAVGMLGGKAAPEITIFTAKAEDFKAVVFVGGSGAKAILEDEATLALAQAAAGAGKLVAAICMAPEILANAGLLQGKKATCWSGGLDKIKVKGALVVDEPVVTDGRIVTGNGPQAAKAFGEAIVEALEKGR